MDYAPENGRRFWWRVAIFSTLAVGALAILIPNFDSSRCHGDHRTGSRNACINNLRQIDGAKEQWAMEKKIASGEPGVEAEIATYIKGGIPKCPAGGKYSIGKVNEPPRCSVPDHGL